MEILSKAERVSLSNFIRTVDFQPKISLDITNIPQLSETSLYAIFKCEESCDFELTVLSNNESNYYTKTVIKNESGGVLGFFELDDDLEDTFILIITTNQDLNEEPENDAMPPYHRQMMKMHSGSQKKLKTYYAFFQPGAFLMKCKEKQQSSVELNDDSLAFPKFTMRQISFNNLASLEVEDELPE